MLIFYCLALKNRIKEAEMETEKALEIQVQFEKMDSLAWKAVEIAEWYRDELKKCKESN